MITTKIKKNYIYQGLGFPVRLKEAEFCKISGKWILKIDVQKVSDYLIKLIPGKKSGLTGAEIKFIRTYFNYSKRKLAEELNISHTAVNKWEIADQDRAKIDVHVEVMLRSFVRLKLKEEKDFTQFYKKLLDSSKNFSEQEHDLWSVAI